MRPRMPWPAFVFGTLLVVLGGCGDPTVPESPTARAPVEGEAPAIAPSGAHVQYVIGAEDPSVDVPAVQQAVDAGGTVVLKGTFDFQGKVASGATFGRHVILVNGPVVVRGEEATILGGGVPTGDSFQGVFVVDAPGHDVGIEGIRFVSPHNVAIRVVQVGDLRIADCDVDAVIPTPISTPFGSQTTAVGFHLFGTTPFGDIDILDNRLRIGGTEEQATGGIILLGPASGAAIEGNHIRETTGHGMNLQDVGGPVRVERNLIETGPVGRGEEPGLFVDALRVLGTGEYRIQQNQLDCGFRNGAVLRVAATAGAVIRQNELTSSVAADEVPGPESAGVQIRGTATENQVSQNQIKGRGRVAISVIHSDFRPDKPQGTDGNPTENTFTGNNVQPFDATVATVEIGEGALDTTIQGGSGTLIDEGTGTLVQGDYQAP